MPEDQGELNLSIVPRERDHHSFQELDADIVDAFWEFHQKHPQVYDLFYRYAEDAKKAGRQLFGIAMIAERVRWYVLVEATGTAGEDFKINNNLKSCYSRLLMIRNPSFEGMFATRVSPGHSVGRKGQTEDDSQ